MCAVRGALGVACLAAMACGDDAPVEPDCSAFWHVSDGAAVTVDSGELVITSPALRAGAWETAITWRDPGDFLAKVRVTSIDGGGQFFAGIRYGGSGTAAAYVYEAPAGGVRALVVGETTVDDAQPASASSADLEVSRRGGRLGARAEAEAVVAEASLEAVPEGAHSIELVVEAFLDGEGADGVRVTFDDFSLRGDLLDVSDDFSCDRRMVVSAP